MAVGTADPRFYDSVRWCVHSLRRWGNFTDDILVITDNAAPDLLADITPHAKVLEVDMDALFESGHQRSNYDKFQVTRLLIHEFVDLSFYQTVMYMDADILAIRDINSLFLGVDEFRYSREFQPMSAPMFSDLLTHEELSEAKWCRAINSGVYAAPGSYLPECLDNWKRLLEENPGGHCYDQPALNAAVLRKMFRAKPFSTFSVGYPALAYFNEHFRPQTQLLHYCGNRRKKFARMYRHYQALLEDKPLQTHFELNEDMDPAQQDIGAQRP